MILDGNYTKVSQVSGIETELDLYKVRLYGFQKGVFRKNVEDIRERIKAGEMFQRVNVIQQSDSEFYMAFLINDEDGKPDGGHHRAYAHYLENKVLPVRIVEKQYICHPSWILINDIKLVEFGM
jgi:hypothetical protein